MCSLTICSNIASPGLLLEHAYWLEVKLQLTSGAYPLCIAGLCPPSLCAALDRLQPVCHLYTVHISKEFALSLHRMNALPVGEVSR